MREKLKAFYEEYEDEIKAAGMYGGMVVGVYSILTGFMIIWKKLGLLNKD